MAERDPVLTVQNRRWALPDLGPHGEGWIGVQTLGIVAIFCAAALAGGGWTGPTRIATVLVGALLVLLGVAMFARGAYDLGRGFSIWMTPAADHVVDSGIYAHVRHPICGGQVLIAFGVALVGASWWALGLAVAYAVLVAFKNYHEETMVERRLTAYAGYRRRVRWCWFPGVF